MPTRRAALALLALVPIPALAQSKGEGGQGPDIAGAYEVLGRDPDGQEYEGTATLRPDGGAWRIEWRIGGQTFQGRGILAGQVLAVDWGDPDPVVYVVMADGSLHGTWSNGRALDRLTPR